MTDGLATAGAAGPSLGAQIAFWIFAVMALVGAVLTITRRNPVTAVVCLVGTFFALAGIFASLSAHFLAVLQVLVYAGAIMVLFTFVIMVLNREEDSPFGLRDIFVRVLGVVAGLYVLMVFIQVVRVSPDLPRAMPPVADTYGSVAAVGAELFRDWLFPFEAISLLLLVAIVGGVVLTQPRKRRSGQAEGGPRLGPGTEQGGA